MTPEVFKNQIARLEERWKYTIEMKKLLYGAIKHLPDHWLESVISNDFIWRRQAPMLSEFKEAEAEFEDKKLFENALPQGMKLPETDCGNCSGSGYATETDARGYRFITRCFCTAGRARSNKLYGPRHTADGEREEFFLKDYSGNKF